MRLGRFPSGTRSPRHVLFELARVEGRLLLLAHDRKHVDDAAIGTRVDGGVRCLGNVPAHQHVLARAAQTALRGGGRGHVRNSKTTALLKTWMRWSIARARRYSSEIRSR